MEYKALRDVPVLGDYDVLVVGGGPSGVCAAVAAAKNGAKTVLVERYGTLGGMLTLGHVGPVMGRVAPGTLGAEILRMGKSRMPLGRVAPDIEEMKTSLTEWVMASGAEVLLQCAAADVILENNVIKGIIAATPMGLQAIKAKIVIDATGDGLIAALAGAPFIMGRENDGLMQPVSLMFSIAGMDDTVLLDENNTFDQKTRTPEFKQKVLDACKAGLMPRHAAYLRMYPTGRPGECYVNCTHKNYVDGTDLRQIAQAERELRAQIPWIIEYMKKNVPGCENIYLKHSSDTLGVRETRHVTGEYILHEEDLRAGRKFEDVVVHNALFYFDVHGMKKGGQDSTEQVKEYDIPYRSLIPLKIDNLLVVGRCISGTHLAHSSYRVMNIAMAIGQAGGAAAVAACKAGVSPRALPYADVQKCLTDMGVELFD